METDAHDCNTCVPHYLYGKFFLKNLRKNLHNTVSVVPLFLRLLTFFLFSQRFFI